MTPWTVTCQFSHHNECAGEYVGIHPDGSTDPTDTGPCGCMCHEETPRANEGSVSEPIQKETNMSTVSMTIAENIKREIERAGTNPHALATATGIPHTTLTRRLRGVGTGFLVTELCDIARVLDVRASSLFAGVN